MTYRTLLWLLAAATAVAQPKQVTVPLILEGNVPMIDLEFTRPDGATRTGRFVVDSGGGAFLLTAKLAKEIGLDASGPASSEEGETFAPAKSPQARVGGMPLDLQNARVLILVGKERFSSRDAADGMLPGHILERYHVIFDYPKRELTLAPPNSLKPRGAKVEAPLRRQNGFPRIEASVAGKSFAFLLDTGASYTMVSRKVMEQWAQDGGAGMPRHSGAIGPGNMLGGSMENSAIMLRLPEFTLAGNAVTGAGVVSRPEGTFEKGMSGMMTGSIIGSIGGNILRQFRVEIDYANSAVYFEKSAPGQTDEMDLVGLALQSSKTGGVTVQSVSAAASAKLRHDVHPGDVIRSIDGASTTSLSLMQIVDRLRGTPGSEKTLVLERAGEMVTVKAEVSRLF